MGYDSLTSVTIEGGVASVGYQAFSICDNLTDVSIGDSVVSIESNSFYDCNNLKNVTIGNGVTTIGGSAFRSCYELDKVTMGSSVTQISSRAFEGCSNLTTVTIPNSVTAIKYGAFDDCNKIERTDFIGTAQEWSAISIASGNNYLLKNVVFSHTETTVSDDRKLMSINPVNIRAGNTVILALYDGDEFVELYLAIYEGKEISFAVNKPFDEAKVMVWDNFSYVKPVCNVEIVSVI